MYRFPRELSHTARSHWKSVVLTCQQHTEQTAYALGLWSPYGTKFPPAPLLFWEMESLAGVARNEAWGRAPDIILASPQLGLKQQQLRAMHALRKLLRATFWKRIRLLFITAKLGSRPHSRLPVRAGQVCNRIPGDSNPSSKEPRSWLLVRTTGRWLNTPNVSRFFTSRLSRPAELRHLLGLVSPLTACLLPTELSTACPSNLFVAYLGTHGSGTRCGRTSRAMA